MIHFSVSATPTSVMLALAAKHKVLRRKMKYSQAEMAQRSGVSLGSLKRFEATGQISLESLLMLANVFHRLDEFSNVFVINNDLEEVSKLFNKSKKSA